MSKYEWVLLLFFSMTVCAFFLDSSKNLKQEWAIKWKKAKRKFENSTFIISITLIIILNIIVYGGLITQHVKAGEVVDAIQGIHSKRFIASLEKANIAIIIGICSYMEVLIPPYWLILVMSYYFYY
jgi:hypothetical protein